MPLDFFPGSESPTRKLNEKEEKKKSLAASRNKTRSGAIVVKNNGFINFDDAFPEYDHKY